METRKQTGIDRNLFWEIHAKISNFSAQVLGHIVFSFGAKEKAWNITTADLLQFPAGSVGKMLGEFLKKNKLEPLPRAEAHDVYHILFDYSTSFKDEIGLQFFLRGNGKTSIASLGTSIVAWCILPGSWGYLKRSYERGKTCADISKFDPKALLNEDLNKIRSLLFINESQTPIK